jgi:hypothetical protein
LQAVSMPSRSRLGSASVSPSLLASARAASNLTPLSSIWDRMKVEVEFSTPLISVMGSALAQASPKSRMGVPPPTAAL